MNENKSRYPLGVDIRMSEYDLVDGKLTKKKIKNARAVEASSIKKEPGKSGVGVIVETVYIEELPDNG